MARLAAAAADAIYAARYKILAVLSTPPVMLVIYAVSNDRIQVQIPRLAGKQLFIAFISLFGINFANAHRRILEMKSPRERAALRHSAPALLKRVDAFVFEEENIALVAYIVVIADVTAMLATCGYGVLFRGQPL